MDKSPIKFIMIMKSNCPIFQWGIDSDLHVFEQLSMNLSGFFGAFNSLITLLQQSRLLKTDETLNHVNFNKTRIYYRDHGLFQSIYIVKTLPPRRQKQIILKMKRLDRLFLEQFRAQLENWDHNIEPFKQFKKICETIL
ncbi:MAG: hypothetical protein ACTSRS_15875 [Candidatus Helarchaeota archaeon]